MAFGCLGRSRPEAGPSLLVAQLWYGLYFAYNACVSPYLTVYLRSLGLAEGLVGVLAFVRPLCSLLGAPLLCAMADATRKHALILQLTVLASVLLRAVLLFMGSAPFGWIMLVTVLDSFVSSGTVPIAEYFAYRYVGKDDAEDYGRIRLWGSVGWGVMAPVVGAIVGAVGQGVSVAFWVSFAMAAPALLMGVFMGKGLGVSSAEEEEEEEEEQGEAGVAAGEKAETPGQQEAGRVSSSSGSSVSSSRSSYCLSDSNDDVEAGGERRRAPAEDEEQLLGGGDVQCRSDGPRPVACGNAKSELQGGMGTAGRVRHKGVSKARKLWRALANLPTITFLVVTLFMGVFMGTIMNFLFLLLEDMGGTETLMGLSLTVTCITETPMFFYAGKVIRKLTVNGVLYITLVCYAIRLFFYAFGIFDPWAVLLVEPLHGITFGACWAACTYYANSIAPKGTGASMQGILSAVYRGLGIGLGSLVGGFVYQVYGARSLFFWNGLVSLGLLLVFWLSQNACRSSKSSSRGRGRTTTSRETSAEGGVEMRVVAPPLENSARDEPLEYSVLRGEEEEEVVVVEEEEEEEGKDGAASAPPG